MMNKPLRRARLLLLLLLPLTLAACGGGGADDPAAVNASGDTRSDLTPMTNDAIENAALAPVPEPASNLADEGAAMPGIDSDPLPAHPRPAASPSPEPDRAHAANVVRAYYARLARGDYPAARAMWDDDGEASGLTPEAFAERFDKLASIRAEVGMPGRIDAGAGQRYVEVPVRVVGKLKDKDKPFERNTVVTLHRTGDIEGATPSQRQWRIAGAETMPRPEPTPTETPTPTDDAPKSPGSGDVADTIVTARYQCENGMRLLARFDNQAGTLVLRRGYQRLGTLTQQRAASGIWYKGEGLELRGKGEAATITLAGQSPVECQSGTR